MRITVVKMDNHTVRIGIDAPEEISIRRQEIVFELPEGMSMKTATV